MICSECGAPVAADARFCPSCGARRAQRDSVAVWIDATPFADFRAGEQGLLRVKVVNEGASPLVDVRVALQVGEQGLAEVGVGGSVAPGAASVVLVPFRPSVGGQYALTGGITGVCDRHDQETGGERRNMQVLTRGPDGGNPTPRRQGHRAEMTARTSNGRHSAQPGARLPRGDVWRKS